MSKELRMPNVNDVKLTGRLTCDPELKHLQSGMALLKLDIAFNRNFKKNDEWQQEVGYVHVTVWGDKAESSAKYLKKGSPVLVEAYLKMESYQNKDNQNINKLVLIAFKVHNLEKDSETQQTVTRNDQI